MKLTCLSSGRGYQFPACHMLQISGVRILLECPLDLSMLRLFLPTVTPLQFQPQKRRRTSSSCCGWSGFKESDDGGGVLIGALPWYKTPDFQFLDISSIDIVLISSPPGFLALPFLTRNKCFSARIYATEAAAKLGHFMMNELVSMHQEFVALYGPPGTTLPLWLCSDELEAVSMDLKEAVLGSEGLDVANWHCLYSAIDVTRCIEQVGLLRFGEEKGYNDTLLIKPVSSGLEIGSSNWIVSGLTKSLAYLTSSVTLSGHSMVLDIEALREKDVLLFSDFSFLTDKNSPQAKTLDQSSQVSKVKDQPKFRYEFPVHAQPIISAKSSGFCDRQSQSSCYANSSSEPADVLKEDNLNTLGFVNISSEMATLTKAMAVSSDHPATKSNETLILICNAATNAIKKEGSVLIPISRFGSILELLEEMSYTLDAACLRETPLFYVSSVAEETLAFTNTVPEWLNEHRKEKLYAGDPLFGHVSLILDKRLHYFPSLSSQKLLDMWQEPCIVFASNWSLRAGPVVHLLQRWRQNKNCLLVITEEMVDIDSLLNPFKPMAMEVLQCPFACGLRLNEITSVIQKLEPRHVLAYMQFPEDIKAQLDYLALEKVVASFYAKGHKLLVPDIKKEIEITMSTDLAFQLRPKDRVYERSTVAKLKGDLLLANGKYTLLTSASRGTYPSNSIFHDEHFKPELLLSALQSQKMCASVETISEADKEGCKSEILSIINITSPFKAVIEATKFHILIKANNFEACDRISKVVNNSIKVK